MSTYTKQPMNTYTEQAKKHLSTSFLNQNNLSIRIARLCQPLLCCPARDAARGPTHSTNVPKIRLLDEGKVEVSRMADIFISNLQPSSIKKYWTTRNTVCGRLTADGATLQGKRSPAQP